MAAFAELVTKLTTISKNLTEHPNYRNLTKTTQKFLNDAQTPNYWENTLNVLPQEKLEDLNLVVEQVTAAQAQLFLTTVLAHDPHAGYDIAPKLGYTTHPNIDNSIITAAHEILHGTWADIYIGLTRNTTNLKAWADNYTLKTLTQNIAQLNPTERTHVLNTLKKTPYLQTVNNLVPTVTNHAQINTMSGTARDHWEWSVASANKLAALAYHPRNPRDMTLTPYQHLQQKLLTLRHYFDRDPQKLEAQLDKYAQKTGCAEVRQRAASPEEALILLSSFHVAKHVLHYDEATVHYVLNHTDKLGVNNVGRVLDGVTGGLVLLSH